MATFLRIFSSSPDHAATLSLSLCPTSLYLSVIPSSAPSTLPSAVSIKAKPSQAKLSQAKVLTGGGDFREAQVDVPLPLCHSCV